MVIPDSTGRSENTQKVKFHPHTILSTAVLRLEDIVMYPGVAWLTRRGLYLMIGFI
jgi:hypothetical protein